MSRLITPDLGGLLGKSIADLCPQGFHDTEANHGAHFVSHAGGFQFGYLCHHIAGSNLLGVSVRVQEIFPECPQVGKWAGVPETDDDLLVFITARRNVNLRNRTLRNVPRKHVGILRRGRLYHYSNREDKVVRQDPAEAIERFRAVYQDPTVDLFFGTLPASTGLLKPSGHGTPARSGLSLKLIRNTYTETTTIGELTINGKFECYVLEDCVRPTKIPGITAIPAGSYAVVITWSPRFRRHLPLLEDVPGFDGIRIHPGNTAADTDGCLLPGRTRAIDFVGESRLAFGALFEKLSDAGARGEGVRIEIVESGASPSLSKVRPQLGARVEERFRVLADPLRLRSSPRLDSRENVTGSLAFGQVVIATGAGAPLGWISVVAEEGDKEMTGLAPSSLLEPVPHETQGSCGGTRTRGRRAASRNRVSSPSPADLFRVKAGSANLRNLPGILAPENVVAALPRGHLVARIGKSSRPMWWKVKTVLHHEPLGGFIHAGLLVADRGGTGTTPSIEIGERALQLILKFEGMDQPSKWAGEKSGISLGRGYDLGYHTRDAFFGDWEPYLTEDQLEHLSKAIGKTGAAARKMTGRFTDITIKRADADAVFILRTLPRIKLWAVTSFPGIETLPEDAQGALVSLVYNRGTSLKGDRRREMREVRDAVADPSLPMEEKLTRIANRIRSMKRLWPRTPGLRRRRDAEANLVESAI